VSLFTIILPTAAHRETIAYAIKSVLDQSCDELELHVIGDGCPPRTREIVETFRDSRLHFVEHPKSRGTGEEYRDLVIRERPSTYVAYLADDDLWTQDHLERMARQLEATDFCHSLMALIDTDATIRFQEGDLRHHHILARMRSATPFNVIGLGCAAHRRDSYLRLPVGWSTRPDGWWSDLWMWRKWLAEGWVRIGVEPSATYLHMPEKPRRAWSPVERLQEIERWYSRSRSSGFRTWIDREMASFLSQCAGFAVLGKDLLEEQRAAGTKASIPGFRFELLLSQPEPFILSEPWNDRVRFFDEPLDLADNGVTIVCLVQGERPCGLRLCLGGDPIHLDNADFWNDYPPGVSVVQVPQSRFTVRAGTPRWNALRNIVFGGPASPLEQVRFAIFDGAGHPLLHS
jgi:hypothetical protein